MSAFGKDLVRTITRKPGRFLALLAIVALGAGFYAGLRMTAPDMDVALDSYLDETHVYDVRVACTLGLEEGDLAALREIEGVGAVMGSRQADVLARIDDTVHTTRVHELPDAARFAPQDSTAGDAGGMGSASDMVETGDAVARPDGDDYLNRLMLVQGRWPEAPGECLVSADRVMSRDIPLGAEIRLDRESGSGADAFSVRAFTVVGKAHMPYYVSSAAIDPSALGSGVVQQVVYAFTSSFDPSYPYTDAFVEVEGAREEFYGSQGYESLVDAVVQRIEGIADVRCRARLDSLTDELHDGLTTYEGLLDLLEYRLAHTKAEIDDPEMPEWLVMDRSKNVGMASFTSDAERVDHIASIFPLMFFLVAALVALTTMTRMVDEERQVIGTYKALGYTRGRITWKYACYVLAASSLGSMVGIAVLSKLLPAVIMNAYAIMYYVPSSAFPIDLPIACASAALVIGIVLVATGASAAATLREKPSSLMLPRAPKTGKRILLERLDCVWSRLSFTWKVTCRNLFRYKKRLVMTVIGIAGCTALLLTGLGLHDAINDIIDIQYGEIIHHNALVALKGQVGDAERAELDEALEAHSDAREVTPAFSQTMLASGPRACDKRIDLVVAHDSDAFARLRTIRTREGHEPLNVEDKGVLLNEKMALELGVQVGDTVRVNLQDEMGNPTSTAYEFTVGGLFENYIYNYLYVSPETYERVVGKAAPVNALFANIDEDPASRAALDDELRRLRCVKTITYNDETIGTYKTMLRSVDLIVVVLVLSAAALAFIVLYNLTNINIEERIREIATLKVLGFTRRETDAYIFREVALLAIIGAALGLALGTWLEGFVVATAEVDQVMFGRSIHPPSYCAGFALTLAFSAVSMLLMLPKLARVDMVESLKSIE